jgi:hypothetical protein
MLLGTGLLPQQGVLWSQAASPRQRLRNKTNIIRQRFRLWIGALKTGRATLQDGPVQVASHMAASRVWPSSGLLRREQLLEASA